jgi:hypothetical protein
MASVLSCQKKRPEGRCGTTPFERREEEKVESEKPESGDVLESEDAEELQGDDAHDRHAAKPKDDAFH